MGAESSSSEYERLKNDVLFINGINPLELNEFLEKNSEWIEDVNVRLEEYLSDIPQEEVSRIISDLQSGGSMTRAYSGNFNWYKYEYRGGYWTYSMTPKMSTRLLRPVVKEGWEELKRAYSGIRNDKGSLNNQYMCHFDLFVDSEWNIEVGRPKLSYPETLIKLCNP